MSKLKAWKLDNKKISMIDPPRVHGKIRFSRNRLKAFAEVDKLLKKGKTCIITYNEEEERWEWCANFIE